MGRPTIPLKLVISTVKGAIPPSNPTKYFFIYKIFLEFKKYIRLIFKYRKYTSLNEFSSSFQKEKKGGYHGTF